MSPAPSPSPGQERELGDQPTPTRSGSRRAFAQDSFVSILGNWSTYLIGGLGGLVLSRSLQPEGKGVYTALFTAGLIAGAISTLGTDLWATKRAASKGEDTPLRALVHRQMVAVGYAACAAASGVIILAPHITTIRVVPLLLVVANFATHGWQAMITSIYRGRRKVFQMLAMQLTNASGFLLAIGLLASNGSLSIDKALAIPCLTRVISMMSPTTLNVLRTSLSAWSDWVFVVKKHITASLGLLLEFAIYRADIFVVGAVLGPSLLGVYSVALPFSELLWIAPNAIASVLLPHIAASKSASATATIVRLTIVISCVAGIGLVLVGPPLITLAFGESFSEAGTVLPMLAAAAVLLSVWKLITTDLIARGDTSARARGAFAALLVLAVTLVPLTHRFGIRGAAAGTGLGYLVALIHGVGVWSRVPDASVRSLIPPSRRDFDLVRSAIIGRSK